MLTLAPCQQQVKARLAAKGVQPMREVVVQEFQKQAVLAGFRKGKAPRQLVEQKYPAEIRQETVQRLTRQIFERVTTEQKLKPVGPFEVTKLDFDEAQGLALEATVEVEPHFGLSDYRAIRVTRPSATVSPEEIDRALQQTQESAAELVPVAEGQPKEKRLPNLDNEFAKDVGFETLEELRQHLEAKLREQKQAEQSRRLEQELFDALLATHQFEVPPRLVTKQIEQLTRDFQVRLVMSGRSEEAIKTETEQYAEQLRANATRIVKLGFVLGRIAEQESLSVTQDELVDRVWKLAKSWGKDPSDVRRWLDAQGLWSSVVSSIRQEKTVQWLLRTVRIEDAAPAASAQGSRRETLLP